MTSIHNEYQKRRCAASDIVDHLPTLYDATCRFPEVTVIELGVRSGNSTAAFLAAADLVGGRVFSVDVDEAHVPAWWFTLPHWVFIQGNDLADEVTAELPEACDVLFIDTSHTYDHTLAELRAYVPRVRPGGVVMLHDTELGEPDAYPVAKALDDYCAETGRQWTNHTGCYGLGVLEV